MQREVNLEPGMQLTEVARTPGDVQRGPWEYLQGSWPLVLSFLPSSTWPQVHVPYNSTHGGCTRYVQPEFHGGYPSQNWLFLVFNICKLLHPSFTPRQATWVKRGDAPVPWRQQNISSMAIFTHFLWGGQHWWATEDWQSKTWGELTIFAHFVGDISQAVQNSKGWKNTVDFYKPIYIVTFQGNLG